MKKVYNLLSVFFLLFIAFQVNAQDVRIITVDGWDPESGVNADDANNLLFDAIDNDSTARKTNPNVIFELKRGQYYFEGKIIQNYDYHLHIRAQEGDGPMPVIAVGKKTDGTYGNDFIRAYNDLTLENLEISGHTPEGAVLNRMIEFYATGGRYTVNHCYYDGDRGSMLAIFADSASVIVKDSKFGNTGHRKTPGGNGRTIDLRPTALFVDTLIVVNSSHYNETDRIIRNMGSLVNYFVWDHNTVTNNKGFHGALQMGDTKTAIVTNNIFANTISLGSYDSRTQEQTQPEKHFSVISLDTTYAGQSITIRNNNIYNDQVLVDIWAKYDSVTAPYEITATIETAIGAGNVAAAWFAEPLTFTQNCGPFPDYVDMWYSNPSATEFPEDWCVGGQGGFFPNEIDFSYPTTAQSYTAGDKGYPVGDLNYFPEMKAMWEKGIGVGFANRLASSNGSSVRAYPNPFNDQVRFAYFVNKAGNVDITIYNSQGAVVKKLVNEFQAKGNQEVTWDGTNSGNAKVSGGVYFYRVSSVSGSTTGSVVMTR